MTAAVAATRPRTDHGASPDVVVSLRGVSRHYPGGVKALDEVDLDIGRGELLAVVGPSGSGKSTMLNVIGTLDRPTAGRMVLDDFLVADLDDRELSALRATRIGFVFQHFHLAVGTSALDNVADGMLYRGVRRHERRERAAHALERVGLGTRLSHRPHELSGGEKQRVAIARAVVGDPPMLLADEPTGALDTVAGAGVMEVLRSLNDSGTTIVIITHDRDLAAGLPRQVTMRDGHVMSSASAVAAEPATRAAEVRSDRLTPAPGPFRPSRPEEATC